METINNDTANRTMGVTKTLNAPVELVWEAWTKPEHIANWWGPNGFTNTIHNMEVKAGGEWRLTMHGPDGKDFPNRLEYIEVEPLKKIVIKHFNPNYIATVDFETNGNETVMEWTSLFETQEIFDAVVKVFKADEGLKQNIEKLENYLKKVMQ